MARPTKQRETVRTLRQNPDNLTAWRLGRIAREAGNPKRKDVGDSIDRGLILLRLLNENGYELNL